ncbi:Na+/H+ antiporter subunit D [Paenibacillus sp. PAMC21692]|uniref:Na+/H+ antiporter subunit D n=1 Tax=Paenibacillus sp. PAMC21692 TaxID=2762320 RepID=UPI00164CE0ED|nr:Na+/H+ antiporter subunit D [Paenibacillus sp. PAMC21692]QNK57128.1 Na+/H+ antiporter subunit D [Paenibacillus sp. PAMC21692]
MNNIVVLPLFIPLILGVSLFFIRKHIRLQQWIAALAALATLAASLMLMGQISSEGIQVLHMGGWEAPYGIPLVADMLAAILVAVASIVTFACLLFSFHFIGEERKNYYVYPLMLILLCGVNGSFLTGDIFNLFVFFEVMLLSSYVLLSLGGGRVQLRETVKYIVINIVASSLFVIAIAYLYSITGTLNLAHIAERVAENGQNGLTTTVSLLLLTVFGLKAGLFLFFWLPGSYSAPSAPIAALFAALLTKVGVYVIIRMFTLIFNHQPQITHTIILWLAALTMILGAIGAIAYWRIKQILAYNVVVSVGFILFGVGVATDASLAGSVFYLVHDMIAKALIFILGGAVVFVAGTDRLREISGLIRYRPILGWLFFLSALALAGVPPLSGFIGKFLILQGGVQAEHYLMAAISLLTSLMVLYSVIKIFINSFWGESLLSEGEQKSSARGTLLPGFLLAALVVGLGLGADTFMPYVDQAVEPLVNPRIYIDAVLS